MAFRLWRKAIKMTLREKKIFVIFTGIYTILIFLTSFFIETVSTNSLIELFTNPLILIFLSTSLILSLLYAWLLVSRNRRIFATLKCIGYENKNINSMITGIIFFAIAYGITSWGGFLTGLIFWICYLILSVFLIGVGLYTKHQERKYGIYIKKKKKKEIKPPRVG